MKNWRYWLIALIALTAVLNLFAVPGGITHCNILPLLFTKLLAALLLYLDARLFAWFAKHRKIDAIIYFIQE